MTEIDVYTGRVRRRCEECGVEVDVQRPTRVKGKDSTRAWRIAYRKEVQRQILWECLCPACRNWWNSTLRRVENQPPAAGSG
jgi:rRNA maturation protein Nop10